MITFLSTSRVIDLCHWHDWRGRGVGGRTLSAMTVAGSVRPENNSNTISSQLRLNNFLDSLHLFGKGRAKISNDFDLCE